MEIFENKSNLIIIRDHENGKNEKYRLYSYTSLIAEYETETKILYLTEKYKYSTTTSKHLNYFIKNYCNNNINIKNIKLNKNINNNNIYKYIII